MRLSVPAVAHGRRRGQRSALASSAKEGGAGRRRQAHDGCCAHHRLRGKRPDAGAEGREQTYRCTCRSSHGRFLLSWRCAPPSEGAGEGAAPRRTRGHTAGQPSPNSIRAALRSNAQHASSYANPTPLHPFVHPSTHTLHNTQPPVSKPNQKNWSSALWTLDRVTLQFKDWSL